MMKKLFLAAIVCVVVTGCTTNTDTTTSSSKERVVLSKFKRTNILLRVTDSSQVKGETALSYDQLFLNEEQFAKYKKAIWDFANEPNSKIYDPPGTEFKDKKAFLKDAEESIKGNISSVDCDEVWYFNPESNMIERELLGYWVREYVKDKEAYRLLFYIAKNESALKVLKESYYSYY